MFRCFAACRPQRLRRKRGQYFLDEADADEEEWPGSPSADQKPEVRRNKLGPQKSRPPRQPPSDGLIVTNLTTVDTDNTRKEEEERKNRLLVKLAKQLQKTKEQNKQLKKDLRLVPVLKQRLSDAHRLVRAILLPFPRQEKFHTMKSKRAMFMLALEQVAKLRMQQEQRQQYSQEQTPLHSNRRAVVSPSPQTLVLEERNRELEQQNSHLQQQVRLLVEEKMRASSHDIQEIAIYLEKQRNVDPLCQRDLYYQDDPTTGSEGIFLTPNGSLAHGHETASSTCTSLDQFFDAEVVSVISDAFRGQV